jgi:hypothetical protein
MTSSTGLTAVEISRSNQAVGWQGSDVGGVCLGRLAGAVEMRHLQRLCTPGMDQGQLVVATANQKIGPPARPQCEGFVAQRHRLGQRLAVHRDHDRLGASQLRIHDAGIGAVDQTQPQPLARSHLEAGPGLAVHREPVTQPPAMCRHADIAERLLVQGAVFVEQPVVQHQCDVLNPLQGRVFLDDQRAVQAVFDLPGRPEVRMIPVGAGVRCCEHIVKALAGRHRILGQRRAVHGVVNADAVPVEHGGLIETIDQPYPYLARCA